jgi:hypothetical protein
VLYISKVDFFGAINIQQVPKPHSKTYYVRKADEFSLPEYTVVGYEFTDVVVEDSIGTIVGFDSDKNFRRVFLPEEGHYWVSRDFSGQELRILANLANEPTWINAFLNNEDIHRATAITVWGEENFTPEKRKAAKTLNFGLIYGIAAPTLSKQLKVSVEEAQSYIDAFFKGLPAIGQTLERFALYAQEHKEITNIYGRKRRMSNFINPYGKITNAGKRRSYNFPIQSLGAEITKLALIKIYYRILNNEKYKGKAFFMNTIHDEINLSVDSSCLKEVVFEMGKCMFHMLPNKPVPIISGLEIGTSMGLLWEFKQDEETLELTPDYSPIPEAEKEKAITLEEFRKLRSKQKNQVLNNTHKNIKEK